ncbi:MAG: BadF/BadG/BcrA/BcrD ATPase family protein [Terriglobia bacterium]
MTVGIDVGSTTTKAVAILPSGVLLKATMRATDPLTAASGSLGRLTAESALKIKDIERISITGVGSSRIEKNIFDIPTARVDEVSAIGNGGVYLSASNEVIITNIGTGTAIVEARNGVMTHLGGTGIGGGTVIGLSKALLGTVDFRYVTELASNGDTTKVDLLIGDILGTDMGFLTRKITACNFGKMDDSIRREDLAAGVLNMVYQAIGVLSVFAARCQRRDMVLFTGKGSTSALGRTILAEVAAIYHTEFVFPSDAEFSTAIGAALSIGASPVGPESRDLTSR